MKFLNDGTRWIFLLTLVLTIPISQAATTAQIDASRISAVGWLIQNQSGSGSWENANVASLTGTSATLDGLRNAGVTGVPYMRGISWLVNAETKSIDGLSRQALSLIDTGINTSAHIQSLLDLRYERSKAWGPYAGYNVSFPETPLVMEAILASNTSYADAGTTLGYIVSIAQNGDGGWPYATSDSATPQSQIIPTAYTLIMLIQYRDIGWGVQGFIDNGIAWLLAQQNVADGSFGDDGTGSGIGTIVETALAYQAISAELGTVHAAAVAAQDFLIAQQAGDGSWSGGVFPTALALQTLPATTLADGDNDGVPDEVETFLGTDPLIYDSRYLASGNGDGVAGETLPTNITVANINQAFSSNLLDTGGTGPFTWVLVSGSLPAGVTMTPSGSTGTLSGTPTEAGTFNFIYEVTDAGGQTRQVVSQIVVDGPTYTADGDLNGDGLVNVVDVLLAQRILTGDLTPTAEQQIRGDVAPLSGGVPAPDGVFNLGDVLIIQRKAIGAISF